MKDKKEIPIWPLYAADALMFVTVFVLVFPSLILRKSLSGGQMFSLSFLVIASMLILLLPYLQSKKSAADDEEKTQDKPDPFKEKSEEQFRLVFSELRAIRGKLAQHSDIIEHSETNIANFEKENSAQFARLQAIDAAVAELKNMLAELSTESEKPEESAAAPAPVQARPDEETENRIKALEVCAHQLKHELEEFKNSFEEIEIDEAEEESASDKSEYEELEEESAEEKISEESNGECNFANESAPQSMEEIACQNSGSEHCGIPDNSDDGGEHPMSYGDIEIPDKSKAKSWEGLIDKALSNSQTSSTRSVVSRFIEKNKNGENAEADAEPEIKSSFTESGESENFIEKDFEQDAAADEEFSEENDEEVLEDADENSELENEDEKIFSEESEDDFDDAEAEEFSEDENQEFEEEESDEEFIEEEPLSEGDFGQGEIFVEPAAAPKDEPVQEQTALFAYEEIPQKEKPKRIKSGDTAFVANAFPGIGNKLYLRGTGGGLLQDIGTPMLMTEIGKWQWKCADEISDDVKFTIWLNDETPAPIGELTLKPNENLEADVNFIKNA